MKSSKSNTEKLLRKVFLKAAFLIDKGWCKNVYARNCFKKEVDRFGGNAVSFCLLGALDVASRRITNKHTPGLVGKAKEKLIDILRVYPPHIGGGLTDFNDRQVTKKPVVNLLRRAAVA